MTIYYKDGFYNSENGGYVPEGAVEITEETYSALLDGQAAGKQIIADSTGNPILIESQPSPLHELKNGKWVISPENLTALFDRRKETLLSQLANCADKLKNGLLAGYPQTEIESFYRQEKEALAWQADNSTATPMLTQIAKMRGVPFEILVQKVIEKSAQFAVAIGVIIGQRQAFEDRLLSATKAEQLDKLETEINEWQFQVN